MQIAPLPSPHTVFSSANAHALNSGVGAAHLPLSNPSFSSRNCASSFIAFSSDFSAGTVYHSPTGLSPLPSLRNIADTRPLVMWKSTPAQTMCEEKRVVMVCQSARSAEGGEREGGGGGKE